MKYGKLALSLEQQVELLLSRGMLGDPASTKRRLGAVSYYRLSGSKAVKNDVARTFGVSDEVLRTWFWTLNEVRNICAHHGRLWNRDLGNKPTIPHAKHHPEWHTPVSIPNHRVFAALTICMHCLGRLAPSSSWQVRLRRLLSEYPRVPVKNMGFPDNWLQSPLWLGAARAT